MYGIIKYKALKGVSSLHVSEGTKDFIFALVYITIIFSVIRSLINAVVKNKNRIIKKKITEIGGEIISISSYNPDLDKHKPRLKEAIKIKNDLEESGELKKRKRARLWVVYEIKYKLDNNENYMYLLKYKNTAPAIWNKYYYYDWVDKELLPME